MASTKKPTTSYPLTTQFIPPTSCFSQYWHPPVGPGTALEAGIHVNGPPIGLTVGLTTALKECWPEDFVIVGLRSRTFYSPGICPSGYITASQSYISRTMYAYCCMSGFELLPEQLPRDMFRSTRTIEQSDFIDNNNHDPVCYQPLQSGLVIEYQSPDGQVYTTDLRKGFSVNQFPIRVKYEATDFAQFPLDAQPTDLPKELQSDLEPFVRSGLVTLATETGSRQTSSEGTTGPRTGTGAGNAAIPSETSGGGSEPTPGESRTGTIAIAVGVTVSVIIVLAVAGYFLFAWRRKKQRTQNGVFPTAGGPYQQHNGSHVGGIQDFPDNTGGIALGEAGSGGWSKSHQ